MMSLHIKSRQVCVSAIYQITRGCAAGWASTSALADHLGITGASVTGMLKKMSAEDNPLIEYKRYGGARLTTRGQAAALRMQRRHALLEEMLRQTLHFPDRDIPGEIARIEHAVSELFTRRLAAHLEEAELENGSQE